MDNQQMVRLAKAKIYELTDVDEHGKGGKPKPNGVSVECMFNPFEYSISKSNNYEEKPKNNSSVPLADFKKAGARTLTLNLVFDRYERDASDQDVRKDTEKLWLLMDVTEGKQNTDKVPPPMARFEWGVFQFDAVITQMTQKFTLFRADGLPLRARVDVTFTEYVDVRSHPRQNPTSGGGKIDQIWTVKSSDRLDTIAYEVYGNAELWRFIAEKNAIDNPFKLQPGRKLRLYQEE